MDKPLLKLFITGPTPIAKRAIENLRSVCENELGGEYDFMVIDVLENPQLAEDERILATPTVVNNLSPSLRRIIGDLSNIDKVLIGLDLVSVKVQNKSRGE